MQIDGAASLEQGRSGRACRRRTISGAGGWITVDARPAPQTAPSREAPAHELSTPAPAPQPSPAREPPARKLSTDGKLQNTCPLLSNRPDTCQCVGAAQIDLSDNHLCCQGSSRSMEGVKATAHGLSISTSLTMCDIRHNKLGAEGWCVIFNTLRDNPQNEPDCGVGPFDSGSQLTGDPLAGCLHGDEPEAHKV
eukprot:467343-Prymnesium_polylepis.1